MGSFKKYYNGLVEEKLSLANKIIDDLLKMDVKTGYEFVEEVESYVEKFGGKKIGEGSFADVYAGNSGGYVIKVAEYDNSFKKFYEGMQGKTNPFLPRILKHASIDLGSRFDLYVMERLEVDYERNKEIERELVLALGSRTSFSKLVEDLSYDPGIYDGLFLVDKIDLFLKQYGRTFLELVEFSKILKDMGLEGDNDLHRGNFGFDSSGGLVFFDPVS